MKTKRQVSNVRQSGDLTPLGLANELSPSLRIQIQRPIRQTLFREEPILSKHSLLQDLTPNKEEVHEIQPNIPIFYKRGQETSHIKEARQEYARVSLNQLALA